MKIKSALKIDFENFTQEKGLTASVFHKFTTAAEKILRGEGIKIIAGRIELSLVDDKTIRKINKKYRSKDVPTDVVSLSYIENAPNRGVSFPVDDLIGEIFISVETAKKQADSDGRFLKDEVIFLFVHGLLHVFGFDHMKESDRKKMFGLQERIMDCAQ